MKRIYFVLLAVLLVISVIIFFILKFPKPISNSENKVSNNIPELTQSHAQKILNEMSNEQKVGQLFIWGFEGAKLMAKDIEFFRIHHLGGVILYTRNITNKNQLTRLISSIQSTNTIPLFISIDQEGGPVSRLQWNDTLTKAQADITNPNESYTIANERGKILKKFGINMNLAPVVEYITNKDSFIYNRLFRETKDDVLQKSIMAVKGYTDAGIIAVPKHFPGDSNTSEDTHNELPSVDITKEQWDIYIQPFSMLLSQTQVDAMMIGHIKFPNIDRYPASISYEIISNRLVKGLGYKGLIISDDMEMGALKNIKSSTRLAKQALISGEDILLYSKELGVQKSVYEYILKEVNDGNMNIDDKVLKIIETKIKYGIIKPN